MTNTESPSGVGFERVPSWEEPESFDHGEQCITEEDIRELEIYGFDSDKRTLVGLGPVERARRSRSRAAEAPESQRAPQSESPGPFVFDDEVPPSLRRRKVGPWAVVAMALLVVAIAALVALRTLAPAPPQASAASTPAVAAAAQPPRSVPEPSPEVVPSPEAVPSPEVVASPEVVPSPEVVARVEAASAPALAVSVERARVSAPVVPSALPVKLPDLAPPTVVDMSNSSDANVGAINVTSNPPANVVLDGRPLGKAPRVVKVPAGLHTLVFIHPLYGRQSLSVNVSPGGTTSASADF